MNLNDKQDMEAIKMANMSNLERKLKENSIKSYGANSVRSSRKRKSVKKEDIKNKLKKLLSIALIIASIVVGGVAIGKKGIDTFNNQRELNAANDFMSVKIVSYLEEANVEYEILSDKTIVITETNNEDITKLYDLMKENNFENDEINYIIFKHCDEASFDKVLNNQGYKSKSEFLNQNYFEKDGSIKKGSEKVFENMVQEGYVDNVKKLQEKSLDNIEKSRGVNYGK